MKLYEIAATIRNYSGVKAKTSDAAWKKMTAKERHAVHRYPVTIYMDEEGDNLIVEFEHLETYGSGSFEVKLSEDELAKL